MIKSKKFIITSLAALSLAGCSVSGTYRGSIEHNWRTDETLIRLQVEGRFGNLLKPLSTAIAFMSGIPQGDFNTFDASKAYIEIQDSNTSTSVNGLSAKLYSENGLLAIKSFSTKKVGNKYYIANASLFESWAEQYMDDIQSLEVQLNQDTVYFGQGSTTSKLYYDSDFIDESISEHNCMDAAGENPYFCTKK